MVMESLRLWTALFKSAQLENRIMSSTKKWLQVSGMRILATKRTYKLMRVRLNEDP